MQCIRQKSQEWFEYAYISDREGRARLDSDNSILCQVLRILRTATKMRYKIRDPRLYNINDEIYL